MYKDALICFLLLFFFILGTYTVQFYDGVIRCVKRIHIKSMPEDAKGQVSLLKCFHRQSSAVPFN